MHRDKKIGFSLGILLLGIVGAFFFRNEPDPFAELPPLDDPARLDAEIAENPISPYTEQPDPESPVVSPAPSPWHVFEPYRPENSPAIESAGLPVAPGAPDPIQLAAPEPLETSRPEIEVGSPFGDVQRFERTNPEAPLPGNENWTAGPADPPESAKPIERTKPAEPIANPPANVVKIVPPIAETPRAQTLLYKVAPGDTLSVLAEKHLGSSRRYMEIYEANRDKLRDPDDIRVGMMIRIPPRVKFDSNQQPAGSAPSAPKANSSNSSKTTITPENSTPFTQEAKTNPAPPRRETIRFMPFSRSPLGPLPR